MDYSSPSWNRASATTHFLRNLNSSSAQLCALVIAWAVLPSVGTVRDVLGKISIWW